MHGETVKFIICIPVLKTGTPFYPAGIMKCQHPGCLCVLLCACLVVTGPSVLEIINSLLSHLRVLVTHEAPSDDPQAQRDEKLYQETLINALGEFANHLPDYQKIDIMMFIMGKVPSYGQPRGLNRPGDILLQNILLKSLLKVSVCSVTASVV